MEKALELLQDGKPARLMLQGIAAEDRRILQELNLLTSHPVLYVCNVAEADAASGNAHSTAVEGMAEAQGARAIIISAAIEAEVAQFPDDEELEFLADLGLAEPGPGPADPRRLRASRPDHLFHRRSQGNARMDGRKGEPGRRRRRA